MKETRFDADALIDASLTWLGVALTEDGRAAVKAHLEAAERQARLVLEFPLGDACEPAAVYRP